MSDRNGRSLLQHLSDEALVKVMVNNDLKGLRPVLVRWCEAVLNYCAQFDYRDNPWWYTERALVGTLSAAAWRCKGWVALEEYGVRKHQRRDIPESGVSNDKRDSNGRIDLYLSHQSRDFVVEAKQAWQSIDEGADSEDERLVTAAESAWEDAGRLKVGEGHSRLAATFVVPFISARKVTEGSSVCRNRVREQVDDWLNSRWPFAWIRADAAACVFPKSAHQFVGYKSPYPIFPGVVLLLRRRLKANRPKPKAKASPDNAG